MPVRITPEGSFDFTLDTGVEKLSLREHLGFTASLDNDLEQQPSWQAFWEMTASDMLCECTEYSEIVYRKYMAHCRYYARLALRGQGEKVTGEGVGDMVVLIYSEDTSDESRVEYARFAFKAYIGGRAMRFSTTSQHSEALASFTAQMYKYLNGVPENPAPVYYEQVVRRKTSLRNHAERLSAVAKGATARGFMLNNRTSLESPKAFNKGPMVVENSVISHGSGDAVAPPIEPGRRRHG